MAYWGKAGMSGGIVKHGQGVCGVGKGHETGRKEGKFIGRKENTWEREEESVRDV